MCVPTPSSKKNVGHLQHHFAPTSQTVNKRNICSVLPHRLALILLLNLAIIENVGDTTCSKAARCSLQLF